MLRHRGGRLPWRTRMFLLHERTRKSLCRLGFVAVVPPAHMRRCVCGRRLAMATLTGAACEAEFSRLLRLNATIRRGRISRARRGSLHRFRDHRSRDEAESPARNCRSCARSPRRVTISMPQVTIELDGLRGACRTAPRRLRDRTQRAKPHFASPSTRLIIASPGGDVSLSERARTAGADQPRPRCRSSNFARQQWPRMPNRPC